MAKKKVSSKKTAGRTSTAKKKAISSSTSKPRGASDRKGAPKGSGAARSKSAGSNKKVAAAPTAKKAPPAKSFTEPKAVRPKPGLDGAAAAADAAEPIRKGGTAKPSSPRKSRAAPAGPSAPDADGYVLINGRRVRMMSAVLAPPPTRRSKSRAGARDAPEGEAPDARTVKSKLTTKQLTTFRELLRAKRAELARDLTAMEKQALQSNSNFSHMPIHMADIGTDTYDQDFMLGLAETERRGLREIDEALQRIHDGTFGICQLTGKPIPLARLNAKPWAKYTIEAARLIERGLGDT